MDICSSENYRLFFALKIQERRARTPNSYL